MSGLLQTLVAMTSHKNPHSDAPGDEYDGDDEESIPVTSRLCPKKVPRQHKDKALKVTDAHFKKHVYGKSPKQKATELKDFDPRPQQYRVNAEQQLPALLASVRGKGLCVSLLFDENARVSCPESRKSSEAHDIGKNIAELKLKLSVSDDDARQIELETKGQRNNKRWFEVRRLRLTASYFGQVRHHRDQTPPDNIVLQILGVKQIGSFIAMQ